MNERGQRISGLRARAIEASLVMPIILAACGGDKTPATQPILPTEQPTPSIIVNPSPEVTIQPSPEITPSPTPEVTPKMITLNNILDAKPDTKTTFKSFSTAIKNVFTSVPEALQQFPNMKQNFADCQNGPVGSGGTPADKAQSCEVTVLNLLQVAQRTGDQAIYTAGEKGLYFFEDTYPQFKSDLLSLLKQKLT